MSYFEEHTADRRTIKSGWIMVLIVNAALMILTL